jgi:uncharacterized protein (TIGR03663 family)
MDITPEFHPRQPERLETMWISLLRSHWAKLLLAFIILLAVASRFYILGARVMSHDENSHVYFSWLYEQGNGYAHDPVTHGPFQFHVVALSYFLFSDNDFTARIPAALFSVLTVAFAWNLRRFLGRPGALVAATLLLISPYILYYGRYVRNEAFVAFFGIVTLWAMLNYLESGEKKYLYYLTAATALHFTSKETSFIYTAQALIFLAGYLVYRLLKYEWKEPEMRRYFIIFMIAALLTVGAVGVSARLQGQQASLDAAQTASPAVPGEAVQATPAEPISPLTAAFAASALAALIAAAVITLRGYTWQKLREERSFAMLVVLGTMVLPMLAPFPVKFMGRNPIAYQDSQTILWDGIFIAIFAALAIAAGLLWDRRTWPVAAVIFYGIFTVFYTSLFTNGFGFVTGLVGSLGYWLEQQAVNRGSQPWYYYGLIQVPIYEYLPALGTLLAAIAGLRQWITRKADAVPEGEALPEAAEETPPVDSAEQPPTLALLLFWSFTSLAAYSIAGEKMPWLTVHIALPIALSAAWFIGGVIERVDWPAFWRQRGLLMLLVLPVFFYSLMGLFASWLGAEPPFQGKELSQLKATSTFLTSLITCILSGAGLAWLVRDWQPAQFYRVTGLTALALLGALTARTAIMASYINYDNATEFLVYAHSARGPKEALEQIEEISRRTTGGLALRIAYDNEVTYPYWWYLRNYPNKDFYDRHPTRAQRDDSIILVGEPNYSKIEPVVGKGYQMFEYKRIWWPNQDYFGLTWQRVLDAWMDPEMRTAIFKIWLNRDYTLYGQLTEKDMSLPNWQPSHSFRMYVRNDVVAQLWNYGASPVAETVEIDPYEGKQAALSADKIIGALGAAEGQFNRPRSVAVASDGSLYVADTENHRIQHLSTDGGVLHVWGGFAASSETSAAPEGMFNEPWGVAVGPDGSVYVADTWNNRIQKFTAEGRFLKTWGYGISQTDDPFGFYGPRGIAVNTQGQVFVTDTGNKRVVVFNSEGNFVTKFGEAGLLPGQFDEPVGIAVEPDGRVFVADTWNQRVQVFLAGADGGYSPLTSWDIVGWYGQSLDNKPFIAVGGGNLFAADPEGYRVLHFTSDGAFVNFWGDYSTGPEGFDLPGGLAVDAAGGVWVADVNNSRLLHFVIP